jgi:hypothetical protein
MKQLTKDMFLAPATGFSRTAATYPGIEEAPPGFYGYMETVSIRPMGLSNYGILILF